MNDWIDNALADMAPEANPEPEPEKEPTRWARLQVGEVLAGTVVGTFQVRNRWGEVADCLTVRLARPLQDFAEGDEVAFDCTPADLSAWFEAERPDRHDRIVIRFDSQPKGRYTRKHFSAKVAK